MPRRRILSDEEIQIWEHLTKKISPLCSLSSKIPLHNPAVLKRVATVSVLAADRQNVDRQNDFRWQSITYSTGEKLAGVSRQGFDAKLDLHGMTVATAHRVLIDFIWQQIKLQNRYLLVITGKGSGTLRSELPLWLSAPDLARVVARVEVAKPKHGGTGAYYIHLRKAHKIKNGT